MPSSKAEAGLIVAGAPAQAHVMGYGPAEIAAYDAAFDADARTIEIWLDGRSAQTQRAYRREVAAFRRFVPVPLRSVTLAHLQAWKNSQDLAALAPSSRARAIAAVKSLFAFACHRLGYLPLDPSAALKSPKVDNTLAERIMNEAEMQKILHSETNPRNEMILRLLYASAVRVSELCGLTWAKVKARDEGKGQITVMGKGGKTRAVIVSATVYAGLMAIKARGAADTDPVFASRKKGGHLTPFQILRIVRAAADRAGVEGKVSPHWFRHAHASHSLQRGATIALVQSTLGHSNVATTGRYLHAMPNDSSGLCLPV